MTAEYAKKIIVECEFTNTENHSLARQHLINECQPGLEANAYSPSDLAAEDAHCDLFEDIEDLDNNDFDQNFSDNFLDDDDDSVETNFNPISQTEIDRLSSWFNPFLTLFARPPATSKNSPACAAKRPEQPKPQGSTLNSVHHTGVLALTQEKHGDLSHVLNSLLNALRSQAISLFRNCVLQKDEIWELNIQHTRMLEFIKHLMPLQNIPHAQIKAFKEHCHSLSAIYDKIEVQYKGHIQASKLVEDWNENLAGQIDHVFTLLEISAPEKKVNSKRQQSTAAIDIIATRNSTKAKVVADILANSTFKQPNKGGLPTVLTTGKSDTIEQQRKISPAA